MFLSYYKPDELLFGWRVYVFEHAYQAEEFADLFNGIAQSGKNKEGKWVALI